MVKHPEDPLIAKDVQNRIGWVDWGEEPVCSSWVHNPLMGLQETEDILLGLQLKTHYSMAKLSHPRLEKQIASITVSLTHWILPWRVLERDLGSDGSFQSTRSQAIPTPICTPFESQRQIIHNLPSCFQIPIRLGVHPYMPVQVIGTLPKFITKSIQRQSILICECINLSSNTFPSHLWRSRSWASLPPGYSLLITRHSYMYWPQEALLPIPFNW